MQFHPQKFLVIRQFVLIFLSKCYQNVAYEINLYKFYIFLLQLFLNMVLYRRGISQIMFIKGCKIMQILQQFIDFILGFVEMIKKFVAEIRSRNDER